MVTFRRGPAPKVLNTLLLLAFSVREARLEFELAICVICDQINSSCNRPFD